MNLYIKKEGDRAELVRILMSNNYDMEISNIPTKTGKSKIQKITVKEANNETAL